jgi:hypothetical protein
MPEHHASSAEASRLRHQLEAIKDRSKKAVIHIAASVIGFGTSMGLGIIQGYRGGKMPGLGPVPMDVLLGIGGNGLGFAAGFIRPLHGSEPLFGAFGNAGFNSFGKDIGLVVGADMKKKSGATAGMRGAMGQGAPPAGQQQAPRAQGVTRGFSSETREVQQTRTQERPQSGLRPGFGLGLL